MGVFLFILFKTRREGLGFGLLDPYIYRRRGELLATYKV